MSNFNEINFARRFYRKNLKRYKFARWLKSQYCNLIIHYVLLKNYFLWNVVKSAVFLKTSAKKFYAFKYLIKADSFFLADRNGIFKMVKITEFLDVSDTRSYELAPSRNIPYRMPTIYPEDFKKFFNCNSRQLHIPSIYSFELANAQIMGKSDFLYVHNQCLHNDFHRFDRDFLFEEMHEVVSINANNKMLLRLKGRKTSSIEAGISLVGSTTGNYVHWLTETMPKLALIDEIYEYKNIPYIIDAGLHPNILESFNLLNSNGRNVIQLGRDEILSVNHLVAISPTAFVPFDFKPGIKAEDLEINPESALYSPDGLHQFSRLILAKLREALPSSKLRIFLRRTGASRPMSNAIQVEAALREHGFTVIEPEILSFESQVRLFSNAELIVGQGGAALGNIIFAPKGCRVVILTTWSPYTIHYYFSNLAAILGHLCTLIMCDPFQHDEGKHRANIGINVPIPTLLKSIE